MDDKQFSQGDCVRIASGPFEGSSGRVSAAPAVLPTTARMPGDRPQENLVVDLAIDGEPVTVCVPASAVDHGPKSDAPPR